MKLNSYEIINKLKRAANLSRIVHLPSRPAILSCLFCDAITCGS